MKHTYTLFTIFLVIGLISCSTNKKKYNYDDKVIAFIDNHPIFYTEIDDKVKGELFDELNRIYIIRKIVLDEVIESKLLEFEARKFNVTKDSLLSNLYKSKINDITIEKYTEGCQLNGKISELGKNLVFHDLKSEKGRALLMLNYKEHILDQYTDSLRDVYKIETLLKSPMPPLINSKDLMIHYRGNLKSQTTLLIISDFDCDMCQDNKVLYEIIYSKYKDKLRFAYTHFGSYVSLSAIASECAANQGKFWEMHDSIYNLRNTANTTDLFRIANNLNMDMPAFKEDFQSEGLYKRIEANMHKIELAGIYGTPTILINDKLVFDSSSLEEIESIINCE